MLSMFCEEYVLLPAGQVACGKGPGFADAFLTISTDLHKALNVG